MSKMIKCSVCNADVASSAKKCVACGAKIKKPFYKRLWFIALVVVCIIAAVSAGNSGNNSDTDTEKTPENATIIYEDCTVSQLIDALEENAFNAKNTYEGKYFRVTGKLKNIDASGEYFSLGSGDFEIYSVQCFLKNDEQKSRLANMNIEDTVTVKGKITDVGEILGYQLKIDTIE